MLTLLAASLWLRNLNFYFWAALTSAALAYGLLRLIFGGPKVDNFTRNLLQKLFQSRDRER